MSKIDWDLQGDRRFETGLDRGVFYPVTDDGYIPGVAWNGLTGVDEKSSSSGDAVQAFYYDGVKYLSVSSQTDFAASIAAVTYPREFEPCVGVVEMSTGVFVTQQASKMFGLCYRTLTGDDLQGLERGYKLHLVYGAMTVSPQKGYSTLADTASLTPFVWDIETVPVETPGFKPMAHLVVDSTEISDYKLATLEDILYGTDSTAPRLPLPSEVRDIVALGDRFIIVLDDDDPDLLPPDYIDGDLAISIDDEEGYIVDTDSDPDISDDVRPVIVIESYPAAPGSYVLEPYDIELKNDLDDAADLAVLVGAPEQWSDSSDGTYAGLAWNTNAGSGGSNDYAFASLPVSPKDSSVVTDVVVHIRVRIDPHAISSEASVTIDFPGMTTTLGLETVAGISVPLDGAIHAYDFSVRDWIASLVDDDTAQQQIVDIADWVHGGVRTMKASMAGSYNIAEPAGTGRITKLTFELKTLEVVTEPLPDYALPGDIVFDKTTGQLYKLGE